MNLVQNSFSSTVVELGESSFLGGGDTESYVSGSIKSFIWTFIKAVTFHFLNCAISVRYWNSQELDMRKRRRIHDEIWCTKRTKVCVRIRWGEVRTAEFNWTKRHIYSPYCASYKSPRHSHGNFAVNPQSVGSVQRILQDSNHSYHICGTKATTSASGKLVDKLR